MHCDGVCVGRSHSIVSRPPPLCSISDLLAKRIKKREELGKNSKTGKKMKNQINVPVKDVFFLFQLSRLLVVKQLVPPLVLLRLKMRLKRVLIRKIPKPFEERTNERTKERRT